MARSSVELLVMALALTHTLPEKPAFAYPEVAALLMAGFLASWRLECQIPLTRDLATLGSDVDLPLPPVHGRYSRAEILAAFAVRQHRPALHQWPFTRAAVRVRAAPAGRQHRAVPVPWLCHLREPRWRTPDGQMFANIEMHGPHVRQGR
jgi:hypothetical protein